MIGGSDPPGAVYDARMYLDALSFLEDERETFRAYEALDALSDAQLDEPVEAAGGWSGRDLMGHMVLWQEAALAVAKELAVGQTSATKDRLDAEWDKPGVGDRMNEEGIERFRAMPIDEVRRPLPRDRGRAARVPDRGAGGAVDQARGPPELVLQRDDRALRGPPAGAARDPRGGRMTAGRDPDDTGDADDELDDAPLGEAEAEAAAAFAGEPTDETLDERIGTVVDGWPT